MRFTLEFEPRRDCASAGRAALATEATTSEAATIGVESFTAAAAATAAERVDGVRLNQSSGWSQIQMTIQDPSRSEIQISDSRRLWSSRLS
jgi:hypothetical protein